MGFYDYNANPDLNVRISGVNIGEGCPPSGINNAIRQIMADAKAEDGAVVHKTGAETVSGAKGFMEKISVYGGVELYPAGGMGANGGYIDFHYAGTTSDYTARIVGQNGELAIKGGGLVVSGSASAETLVVDKVNSASIVEVRGTYSRGVTVGGYDMQLRANTNGNRGLYDPQSGAWAVRVDSGGSAYYAGGQVAGGLQVRGGLTVSGGIQMPELNTSIPAEDSANHSKFLRGDGKWRDVEYADSAASAGHATSAVNAVTAGTATIAGTISTTLPVSKGGTGATTLASAGIVTKVGASNAAYASGTAHNGYHEFNNGGTKVQVAFGRCSAGSAGATISFAHAFGAAPFIVAAAAPSSDPSGSGNNLSVLPGPATTTGASVLVRKTDGAAITAWVNYIAIGTGA